MSQRGDALRDLLFVMVGLQNDLLDRDALLRAFKDWDCAGSHPLIEELLRKGVIAEDRFAEAERLVTERLKSQAGANALTLPTVGFAEGFYEGETLSPASALSPTLQDIGQTLSDPSPGQAGFLTGQVPPRSVGDEPYGRYRRGKAIGEGGLGLVWIAVDTELNREVALKEIKPKYANDPTSQSRFVLEAEVTGGLEHPGIVPVYGLGSDPHGRPYYAMKFIRGDSLKDVITRFHEDESLKRDPGTRGLELRKLLRRFVDVCNAIEYAHTRNILHRDIKPANVMVGPHGETLVVDWGIAKATWHLETPNSEAPGEKPLSLKSVSGATETLPGSTLGTPAFMSAEQARGELEKLGPASDVYSLGATLYNLLTGKPPFEDGTVREILLAVERGDFPPPRKHDRTIDPALEAVCLKAMALVPVDRYPSARMLAEDIERWMADEPVSARKDPFLERATRWMRRRRTAVTAAAAAVLVAIVGLVAVLIVQRNMNQELSLANQREQEKFELAMEAVRTFHTGVSEDFLLKQREFEELRDKLLNKAKEFYRGLERKLRGQSDDASRQALGNALYEVGVLTSTVGVKTEALASHRDSLAIRRELAYKPRATATMKLDLGRSLTALAVIEQGISGMRPGAERDYDEALAVLDPLSRIEPGNAEIAAALAFVERRYGKLLAETNRLGRARLMYDRSRLLWETLVSRDPNNVEASSELAWCHHYLGDLHASRSETEEAMAEYERAQAIRIRTANANPELLRIRADLASSDNTIGRFLANNARTEQALTTLRRGLATRKELARTNAAVTEFQDAVARSYHSIAMVLAKNGRTDEANDAFRESQSIRRELVRENPNVLKFRMDLAASLSDMAGKIYLLGRIDEAIKAFTEAKEIEQKVVDENGTVGDYKRNLALSHLIFGTILSHTGPPAPAIESYQKARDILKGLTESDPGNQTYALELVMAYLALTDILGVNGQPVAASENDALARSILDRMPAEESTETPPKLNLALCNRGIASLLLSQGQHDRAREKLKQAKDILLSLQKNEPNEAEYQRTLAATEDLLCTLELKTEHLEEARAANRRAKVAWTTLLQVEPTNYENQEGQAANLRGLAEILKSSGKFPEASTALESARLIAEDLARTFSKVRRFQVKLAESQSHRGVLLLQMGQRENAIAALNRAVEILQAIANPGPGDFFLKACAKARLFEIRKLDDDASQAIISLKKAFDAGFVDLDQIRTNKDLDSLHARDDYKKLVEAIGNAANPSPTK